MVLLKAIAPPPEETVELVALIVTGDGNVIGLALMARLPPRAILEGTPKKEIVLVRILPDVVTAPVVLTDSVPNSFNAAPTAPTEIGPDPVVSVIFFEPTNVDRIVPALNEIPPAPTAVNVVVAPDAGGKSNCDAAV